MKRSIFILVTFVTQLIFAFSLNAQSGALDPDYGYNGTISYEFPNENKFVPLLLLDGSHLVLVDAGIIKVKPNGQLDQTFDSQGMASIGQLDVSFNQIELQPDGKIILIGSHWIQTNAGENYEPAFARLLPNGTLDTSFGDDGSGVVILNLGFPSDQTFSFNYLKKLNDQYIFSGHRSFMAGSGGITTTESLLIRYSLESGLDLTFGQQGFAVIRSTNSLDENTLFPLYGLCMTRKDGFYYLAGRKDTMILNEFFELTSVSHLFISRIFATTGEVDHSYGTNGFAYSNSDMFQTMDLIEQISFNENADRLYLLGIDYDLPSLPSQLLCFKVSDASQEPFFGTNGIKGFEGEMHDFVIAPSGDLFVAGGIEQNGDLMDFCIEAIHENGSKNLPFGNIGRVVTPFSDRPSTIRALTYNGSTNSLTVFGPVFIIGGDAGDGTLNSARYKDAISASIETTPTVPFSLHPNPATDYISIELDRPIEEAITATIFSVDGKAVHSFIIASGSKGYTVQLSELAPGFYHLQFSGSSHTQSLIKK